MIKTDLLRRMRRNRSSAAIRDLVRETRLHPSDFIQPLFVQVGGLPPEPIGSMPGVFRLSIPDLVSECKICRDAGIRAVAIFPKIDRALKDPLGSHATAEGNLLFEAIRRVKAEVSDLLIVTDVALDPYTDHGHDGVLEPSGRGVENDLTVDALCQLAIAEAAAGADIVAPSDMMDGRVRAIREALDAAGFERVAILSYAVKYASAYYGPFRDAVGSKTGTTPIDKRGYQMDPANVREAALEIALDEWEGADIVMVKPAGPYLDVIRCVRESTSLPVAAYQVSGEYSQIHAAAQLGWLDYEATRDESLVGIKRAGADIILTYFAKEMAANLSR